MVLAPDVETGQRVVAALARASERMAAAGRGLVLLAPADLRRPLREFTARFHPDVAVLAHREIAPKTKVVTDHTVELEPTQARAWVPSVAAA
jgi:flagellar biosynthesis protein FlhA